MKEALSRQGGQTYMPPKVHTQESKENVYSQSYVSKSPFATDYPEKPKTFSKQSA